MTIGFWNIEGLLKYESSAVFKDYIKKFDIFGFCETWSKCISEFDSFINGYKSFNKVRKKRYRKGRPSGGVTVFVKYNLIEGGLVERVFSELEDCVVLLIKGIYLNYDKDIILCFLYLSPEGSPIYTEETGLNGIDILDNKLLQIVQKYPDASLMLAGDFNARCGEYQDILVNDSIDFIFDDNGVYESDEFNIERNTKDSHTNNFGISLIELCKIYSIHILNGRFPGDSEGEITCVANEGSSIVDYFIASSNLFQHICEFEVCTAANQSTFHLCALLNLMLEKRKNP